MPPPPLIFQLLGYQRPKIKPLHIFGSKSNLKAILDISRFLTFAVRGQQISIDIIVEKINF